MINYYIQNHIKLNKNSKEELSMYNDGRIDTSDYNSYDSDDTDIGDTLFDTLPLGMMSNNIIAQINCDIGPSTDFVDIVFGKFNMILDNKPNYDDDDVQDLKIQINDFCHDMISKISDRFNLICNFNYMDESLQYMTVLESLYNFFILDKYDNVETFLISYIRNNCEYLASQFDTSDETEDVTTSSNRQRMIDDNMIVVLSHVDDVLELIRDSDISPIEFIDLIDDGNIHISNIREYIESEQILGDFVHQLLTDIITDYSDYSSTQIRASIRTAFMMN